MADPERGRLPIQGKPSVNSKWMKNLDPGSPLSQTCHWISLITGFMSPFMGPLFSYIPGIGSHNIHRIDIDYPLAIVLCVLRSVLDFLYFLCIIVYILRCIKGPVASWFEVSLRIIIDLLSILPVQQFYIFGVSTIDLPPQLWLITILQSVMAMKRAYESVITLVRWRISLSSFTAAYVYICMIVINMVGAFWYSLSIYSVVGCWVEEFHIHLHNLKESSNGDLQFNSSCSFAGSVETFDYGICTAALKSHIVDSSTGFFTKWLYCTFWALRNLSSLGQNLETSTDFLEILFATTIPIISLASFAVLVAIIQNSLQNVFQKRKEKDTKEEGTEAWMSHQNVPEQLRDRIRQHEEHKLWECNWLVEEETLVSNLPKDIRKDLKRYLCSPLVAKVPQFKSLMRMDPYYLDALCDRLKPVSYMEKTCILREGEPVEEMIFIKEGNLETRAKNTRRAGSYNLPDLKDGDFCGEELVTWALNPNSSSDHLLPISTKTVETISKVTAYALSADDLKSIASSFPPGKGSCI